MNWKKFKKDAKEVLFVLGIIAFMVFIWILSSIRIVF